MTTDNQRLVEYVRSIRQSRLSIYDRIEIGDPELWIPASELEQILNNALVGQSLAGLPLRTRSKVAKQLVCDALGYPIPSTFRRTKPRFPGQLFDTYVQKSNNLQIWNEDVEPSRRYIIIRVGEEDEITVIKVVSGTLLATYDRTGTLTQKHQARLTLGESDTELSSSEDTEIIKPTTHSGVETTGFESSSDPPQYGHVIPINNLFDRLAPLIGHSFRDAGHDQERNRGASLHKLVCRALGYARCEDDGRFPDIRHQLLEIKLQTARTIDLGLVSPDSTDILDTPMLNNQQIRQRDVRYAVFCATSDGSTVTLTHLILTTGTDFFNRFQRFGGNVVNKKIQIRLPNHFFDSQPK